MTFSLAKFRYYAWLLWWSAKWYYLVSIPIPCTVTNRKRARSAAKELLLDTARHIRTARKIQRITFAALLCAVKLPTKEFDECWPPKRLRRYEKRHRQQEMLATRLVRHFKELRKFLTVINAIDPRWNPNPEIFLREYELRKNDKLLRSPSRHLEHQSSALSA